MTLPPPPTMTTTYFVEEDDDADTGFVSCSTLSCLSSSSFSALSLDTVIGAISAENTVVLKPSKMAPACCSFLGKTLLLYLDPVAIRVVEGGLDICEKLLQQKWDKIFFTGTLRLGSLVMSATMKNLTPVTLELGGKSPAIVDTLSNSAHVKVYPVLKRTGEAVT